MPKGSLYFDSVYHPLEKAESPEALKNYDWESHKVGDEYVSSLRGRAEHPRVSLYTSSAREVFTSGVRA
ncbi:MAG: hypothetical protein HA496_05785 [Thaumarchaeota archaeon]|nr:hypothetical protein [Nitrososphaerota archaeon]